MYPHLFTPGPVNVPYSIRSASAAPLIGHRTEPFFALLEEISSRLKKLLGTSQPVVTLPSSGTGALEALAANLLVSGDTVISFSCGAFGDRFREIAERRGVTIHPVDIPHGWATTPEDVESALERHSSAAALLFTHNETSTGVVTDLRACTESLPEDGPLVLVDAVSSLGAMPCRLEEWSIDGLASCSQKGLLTPPGIGIVALSERGWKRAVSRPSSSYYFDLSLHRRFLEKARPQNPYTPPVTLLRSLLEALQFLDENDYEKRFAGVERMARTFETACEAMGLCLFVAERKMRSPAVTAVTVTKEQGKEMKHALATLGVAVAEGQGKEPLLRMAHYSPGGWPELCLLAGSVYGAGRACGLDLSPDFLEAAWNCWDKGGCIL